MNATTVTIALGLLTIAGVASAEPLGSLVRRRLAPSPEQQARSFERKGARHVQMAKATDLTVRLGLVAPGVRLSRLANRWRNYVSPEDYRAWAPRAASHHRTVGARYGAEAARVRAGKTPDLKGLSDLLKKAPEYTTPRFDARMESIRRYEEQEKRRAEERYVDDLIRHPWKI